MDRALRGSERRYEQAGRKEIWHSFSPPGHPTGLIQGFGVLVAFDEMRLPPGESLLLYFNDELETAIYVYQGAISQSEVGGISEVLQTGEFQCMSSGRGGPRIETSVSRSRPVQLFRIALRPDEIGLTRATAHKRFTAAQRRNTLCVVASSDGREGSLRLHQDAIVYSAVLEPGQHVAHALEPQRTAWLHIVRGSAVFEDLVLSEGDGIGVALASAIALTAQEDTEILLVDLGPPPLVRNVSAEPSGPTVRFTSPDGCL